MIDTLKNKKKYILIWIFFCIFSVFIFNNFDFNVRDKILEPIKSYTEIASYETNFSQDFYSIENNLNRVDIYCATYQKTIDSILSVKITDKESGNIIFDKNIDTKNIEDNSTTSFAFENQPNSKGKLYNVNITCIENNTSDGISFALISREEKTNSYLEYTYSNIDNIENIHSDLSIKMEGVYYNYMLRNSTIVLIVSLLIIITILFIYNIFSEALDEIKINKLQIVLNFIILSTFIIIGISWLFKNIPLEEHPDEKMRMLLPMFMYKYNKLPLPRDPEVLYPIFNASYAYYPLYFGPIVATIFMKIGSIFGFTDNIELIMAARFTNLFFGAISIIFLMKISRLLIKKDFLTRNLLVIIGSFIPQFIYLSSYYNSDILTVAAAAIMVYSWLIILKNGWNIKRAILLSIGIIICALSYYNAYGWILLSMFIFVISFIKKKTSDKENIIDTNKIEVNNDIKAIDNIKKSEKKQKKFEFDYKNFLKYGSIISIIVLLCITYFFIRNIIVNNGDMLGIDSFLQACEEGGREDQKPSNRKTGTNLGFSYWYMLTSKEWTSRSWFELTFESFICVLASTTVFIAEWTYIFYAILFIIGLIFMIIKVFSRKEKGYTNIFYLSLLLSSIIVFALSIQYSYATDYQPQGRYLYSAWIALIIFVGMGLDYLLNNVISKIINNKNILEIIKTLVVVIIIIVLFYILLLATQALISFQL